MTDMIPTDTIKTVRRRLYKLLQTVKECSRELDNIDTALVTIITKSQTHYPEPKPQKTQGDYMIPTRDVNAVRNKLWELSINDNIHVESTLWDELYDIDTDLVAMIKESQTPGNYMVLAKDVNAIRYRLWELLNNYNIHSGSVLWDELDDIDTDVLSMIRKSQIFSINHRR